MNAIHRPFKVLGIQQIAIGGTDKVKLQKLWVDLFGLEFTGTYKSDRENVDEDICAIGSGPFKVEVDLMQPLDIEKKPAVHTTPLNHVGLWVDKLPEAVEWLGQQGVRFALEPTGFHDPQNRSLEAVRLALLGVFDVELVQASVQLAK